MRVDGATGRLAGSSNPRVILEAFKPGTAPEAPRAGDGGKGGASDSSPDIGTGGLY
jgi:hypothetical protein